MNLIERYSASHSYSDKPIRIPHLFISSVIVVRVTSVAAQPSWRRAGWMTPVIESPELTWEGVSRRVYLATKARHFESLGLPFQLNFNFVGWLSQAFITVWEPNPPIESPRIDILRIEKQIQFIAKRDVRTEYDVE